MTGQPSYAWYGDDFTGATDTLATLASRGVSALLFLGVPSPEHLQKAGSLEAIGIAGAARSMGPQAMVRELEPVGAFFQKIGAQLIHYKCCSTFDSGPLLGNLVTAVETLSAIGAHPQVVVLGGQPSLGRYCAFGNLFAAAGQDGQVYRLDRHPTMSRHPATPMGEADLRRHLMQLGAEDVDLVSCRELDSDIDPDLGRTRYVLLDALQQAHIDRIGTLLRARAAGGAPQIVLGASSVAQAMFSSRVVQDPAPRESEPGPTLAIAGSLSPLTRVQIAAATRFHKQAVAPDRLIGDTAYRDALIMEAGSLLKSGANVLVTTSPEADRPAQAADSSLAAATGRLANEILKQAAVRRLLVAGGDTSSHVVQNLGFWGLSSAGSFSPGVALSRSRSDVSQRDGMCLLLKGGQMGDEAIFNRFAN